MRFVDYKVELRWTTPNALAEIASAAKLCYQTEGGKSDEEMVRHVISLGHESVLEHACASFNIICDRGVTHEIVRHRLASYSQESTRYCNYSKDKFAGQIALSPMNDELTSSQLDRRKDLWQQIEAVYLAEIQEGVKPQQARDVLPTCTKSEIRWTANFREWRLIFSLRTSPKAHPRMRRVAQDMADILANQFPCVFGGYASGHDHRLC